MARATLMSIVKLSFARSSKLEFYSQVSAVTSPYNGTILNGSGNRFIVILQFGDGLILNTGRYFEYRGNPRVDSIQPLVHRLNGGSLVTVIGNRLDSVAVPDISVTVSVTRGSLSVAESRNIGPCKVSSTTAMTCVMPAVPLPDNLRASVVNGTVSSPSSRGNNASLQNAGAQQEADIRVGLMFDGFTQYNDLMRSLNGLQFTFLICQPRIQSSAVAVELHEESDHNIVIRGTGLQSGCTLSSYRVMAGQSMCTCSLLDDTRLSCQLPVDEPQRSSNDTFCSQQTVALLMYVEDSSGPFFVVCVRYVTTTSKTGLIVGLTVGLVGGGLAVIAVVVAVVLVLAKRRRKRLVKKLTAATVTSTNAKLAETYKRKRPIVYLNDEDIITAEQQESQS